MIVSIVFALLAVAAAAAIVRLVRGPSLADRVIALDVVLVILMSVVAVAAVESDSDLPLGVIAAIAIVAFGATVVLARWIEESTPESIPESSEGRP